MQRRAMVGGVIIAAWLAGIALLIRQAYFRPQLERLAEAATRVTPGAVFFGVLQGGRQVGFASTTVDTTDLTIGVTDYLVADLLTGSRMRRATARSSVTLTRGFRMVSFDFSTDMGGPVRHTVGTVDGDSLIRVAILKGSDTVERRRIPIPGPVLLNSVVPIAVALSNRPKVGRSYLLPVFDPTTLTAATVDIDIRAETTFVVHDSSAYDSTTARWHGLGPDSVRAWRLVLQPGDQPGGWIDDEGSLVAVSQYGLQLRRLPYEVAFENWRNDSLHLSVGDDRDVLATTAIAAGKHPTAHIDSLRIRLFGADLSSWSLGDARQHLSGDTLTILPVPDTALVAPYLAPRGGRFSPADVQPTRLLQSRDTTILKLAVRAADIRNRGDRNPRSLAERVAAWIADSIKHRPALTTPNALQVARAGSGDCAEHTQLFIAVARALGIPARAALGLLYVDGKFYFHTWAEVRLGDWVPVDPTFGQLPGDAAHVRFAAGTLERQADVLRLLDNLQIEVISVDGHSPRTAVATP